MPPEEVQMKRSRGELSCAECRRCRIRCDRKVPCGSCVRRGCVPLCPNGSLRAGHGSRFVLADTEELHSQIAQMSQRIRQLEEALASSHNSDPHGDRHPLLRDELLAVKFGSGSRGTSEESDGDDMFTLSFGTLAITDTGGSSYFGVSAGALAKPFAEQALSSSSAGRSTLPPHDIWNHNSRGQSELPDDVLSDLRRALPSHSQAVHLCEQYKKWYRFQPIQIGDLMDDVLPFVYEGDLTSSPHKLAVLYFVFAAGSLMDPALPPRNARAEAFCELGLKALDLRNVSASTEVETVIAISLLASYHGNLGTENCLETAWEEMSLAIKVAQKIGLHREPSRWNLEPQQVQKRRRLFWELMSQDGVRSLSLGRPPTMSLKWVDCYLPTLEERTPEQILATFQYSVTKEVIWPLMELIGSTSPSSYGAVLALDKKIRELSSTVDVRGGEQFTIATASAMEWNCILGANARQAILLWIHRPFLAMALLQHPENPFESVYSQSVLAAQQAASFMIRTTARYLDKAPESILRHWDVWVDIPSAAITAASIAIHAPNMPSSAMSDLDLAIRILERGADHSWYARVALVSFDQNLTTISPPIDYSPLFSRIRAAFYSSDEAESERLGDIRRSFR
ncbi:hypothetical protein BJ322DRAFT_455613 [Thelephora terrestris]|uniref:Zn(2)-C6 fungal-type domain-containing protein n=1 Tax=Thelephora terrestris TaxID=56493 RepID=A0A9P6H5C1_9AGAM|nr:hypothetical protein BJ322DRAFT_455613 [Thelephora terrestris]